MANIKLLLCRTIEHLGIVGDVVEVAPGYARNYLLPQGLATEPTETNTRALAEARKVAELELKRKRAELAALAERLEGAEVTIRARANEQGHLYGSVGPREVAAALQEEGFGVHPDRVVLADPIRQLDNVSVPIKLADGLEATVKVWVVRDKIEGEESDEDLDQASDRDSDQESDQESHRDSNESGASQAIGMEADSDGDDARNN